MTLLPTLEEAARRSGAIPLMLQDDCRALSKWLANRIDSRMHAREASAALRQSLQALEDKHE